MRRFRSIGIGFMVSGLWLAAACAVNAQNSQQNTQQQQQTNQNNGAPPPQNNLPYTPPSAPPGGYGDAATGSYTGKGSSGYGSSGGFAGPQTIAGAARNAAASEDTPQNQQQLEMQQARLRNAERQKQLVSDTQKLVALATELQDEVSKSSKDMLSLDVVRKAEEIDKLARSVRDRMKNAN